MNRIMIPGVAAVALAASALLTPTAEAQRGERGDRTAETVVDNFLKGGREDRRIDRRRTIVEPVHHRWDKRQYNRVDQRQLRRQAARMCRRAIAQKGYNLGFRDVDFDGRRIQQIGPRGFAVQFNTEFEGRRREFQRNVYCEVRRGRIVALEGVPVPGNRGRRGYSFNYSDRSW